ncbi:hypothetical protein, partial [Mesorhizobium sp. M2A.F.Ca.ET.037.01.1.1]|uniref:hypothetical protein n=1 Tax=Mesorhizobium sp. M2A.F.Ca.ET.037.01.1.1 TaxID=2496748 RepID=UPI001AED1179
PLTWDRSTSPPAGWQNEVDGFVATAAMPHAERGSAERNRKSHSPSLDNGFHAIHWEQHLMYQLYQSLSATTCCQLSRAGHHDGDGICDSGRAPWPMTYLADLVAYLRAV